MLLTSLHLALLNSSTIESLDRHTKVWTLAILIPRPKDYYNLPPDAYPPFPIVSYPGTTSKISPNASTDTTPEPPRREFAILDTHPGENPFDLGNPFANLKEVMGYSVLDWLLPVKNSPCSFHSNQESAFRLGPVVQRMKREAGLDATGHGDGPKLSSGERGPQTKNKRRSTIPSSRGHRGDKHSSRRKSTAGSRISHHSHDRMGTTRTN